MEITTKVVKSGHWFQLQIVQIEDAVVKTFSGPDKNIERKEKYETICLTFGNFFETNAEAETFAKTKMVKSTIKIMQKNVGYF
jgi:hypothetical protein